MFCGKVETLVVIGLAVAIGWGHGELVTKNDKLVLGAKEIIDLVQEEQQRSTRQATEDNVRSTKIVTDSPKTEINIEEGDKDEIPLKSRKVWSRWSKWGQCSVTCGSGTIARRRTCVAGHCAPGECEMQVRPCDLRPCSQRARDDTDDQRDND